MGADDLGNKDRLGVYLAEYSALRAEMLMDLEQRNRILLWTLGAAGALLAFSFTALEKATNAYGITSRDATLVVPYLTSALLTWWYLTEVRIRSFSSYIKLHLAPKVRVLGGSDTSLLYWEESEIRTQWRSARAVPQNVFLYWVFAAVPAGSWLLWFGLRDGSHAATPIVVEAIKWCALGPLAWSLVVLVYYYPKIHRLDLALRAPGQGDRRA